MIQTLASAIYGAVAARRRAWYARHPDRIQRLSRPVISVGNLSVGGSGKTPVVAALARLLVEHGERPAVLSRGYARRKADPGVVVVSDGTRVLTEVDRAGDEPFMLASSLTGVPVVVSGKRFEAGQVAEQSLGATVHLLDDGFQHVALARDVNLLLLTAEDLQDRVLPAGRLRESLSAASGADVVLTDAASESNVRRAVPGAPVFTITRDLGPVRVIEGHDDIGPSSPVFLFAAIARPERFDTEVRAAGCTVKGSGWFRDHHWYTAADRHAIANAARAAGATVVMTTEKDAVRLGGVFGNDLTVAVVPLTVRIDPAFTPWLLDRLARVKSPAPRPQSPAPDLKR